MSKVMDLFFKIDVAMTGKVDGYTSKLTQQLTRAQEAMNKINKNTGNITAYEKAQSEIVKTNSALGRARYAYNAVTPSVKAAQSKCSELAVSLGRERGILRQTGMLHGVNSKEYQEQAKRVRELEKAHREAAKSYQKFSDEQLKAGDKVRNLEETLANQKSKAAELGQALESAGVNTSKLTSEQARLQAQMDKVVNASARLQDIKSKLNWGNIKADFLESAAYFKTFQKPIKVSMDFEEAMAKVKAAAFSKPGADMAGFQELRTQAIQLGRDTQYTSIEAANTQENLLRGGMTWQETRSAMPGVMAMAGSEKLPLAEAANMIVASLAGLNLKAEDSTRVADLYANASVSAKANIRTIYETVSKMSGLATELKMPVEHIVALAAAGQMKGVDPSVLGTGLKTGLLNLSNIAEGSSGKGRNKVMNNGVYQPLNLVISKDGHMRSIDELLGDLYTKLQGVGDTKKLAVLGEMFGKRQADTWAKLMQTMKPDESGQTLLTKYIQSNYTEADGLTQRMQAINLDTMKGQIDLLTSAWTGLQQKIGDALEPINRYVVETLTKGINAITEFANSHENLINAAVRAGYILGGVFVGFKIAKYIKLVYDFITAWFELQAATAAVSMSGAASAVGSVGTAASASAGGVGLMTSSMGLLAIKIMAVVGAIQLLITYWDQIKALPGMIDNVMKSAEAKKSLGQVSTQGMKRDNADYGIAAMNSAYQIPSLAPSRKRALGGLITRPEIALIGEAGPEVVIPLSPGKKSRGLQMLNTAAGSLGVNLIQPGMNDYAGEGISNNVNNIFESSRGLESYPLGNSGNVNQSQNNNISPAVNITVNANNSNLDQGGANELANNIYDRVREALSEIMNNQDRVSFA